MISSVTGDTVDRETVFNAAHWRNLLLGDIGPTTAFESLRRIGINILLELGSRTDVGELGAESVAGDSGALLNSLNENGNNAEQMIESLGELYRRGVEVDWLAFHGRGAHRVAPLPTYAFERKRFWIDTV
jgi:acyl transferase domain-containing protein